VAVVQTAVSAAIIVMKWVILRETVHGVEEVEDPDLVVLADDEAIHAHVHLHDDDEGAIREVLHVVDELPLVLDREVLVVHRVVPLHRDVIHAILIQ